MQESALTDETWLAFDTLAYLIEQSIREFLPDTNPQDLKSAAMDAILNISESGWEFCHPLWPGFDRR